MIQLEVFFDYACPYCLRGHEHLMDLLPAYPHIEVVWRPCEAHPRPDRYGPHSDLCIQGLLYAQDQGADLNAYHLRMYDAALRQRADIEDIDTLADLTADILEPDGLREALRSRRYLQEQLRANRYAFEQSGVWAVPSYRMAGRKLDSIEDVGVGKEQLRAFLELAPRVSEE